MARATAPADAAPTTDSAGLATGGAGGGVADVDAYLRARYGDWRDFLTHEQAAAQHARNVAACRAAAAEFAADFAAGGKLKVLALHSSGRASAGAAGEPSNSQLLLRHGLKALAAAAGRFPEGVEVDEVSLGDYPIEPCAACYSTTSPACTFPCTPFPFDGMQELYPKVLRADCILISAPTNQAAMPSRLKLFVDRLISLDGGYFVDADQYRAHDAAFRAEAIALAVAGDVRYDQRLHNKVAAFFISNKDDRDTGYEDDNGRLIQSYVGMVVESLYRGFYNFGCAFPDPCHVAFRAVPQEDMCYDKARLAAATPVLEAAGRLVLAALERVRSVRARPLPAADNPPGRT